MPQPGLKPGRVIQVIRVNRVTFCPGQVDLTRFIRYPGLTQILHCITCVDDGIWLLWRWKCISSFCSRCFESGHWWRLYEEKDTKGSRAWQQFRNELVSQRLTRIVFNPGILNEDSEMFRVMCCCVCKAYFIKESDLL